MSAAETARQSAAVELKRRRRLTPRWYPLKYHKGQQLYYWSPVRFKVVPPGRRSGKTENAKRKVPRELVKKRRFPTRLLCGAPTVDQARNIWWEDLKLLIPRHWLLKDPNESRMEIWTKWGAMLRVTGFDRPQRIEGVPWDHVFLDEIADCPRNCFGLNLRPALSTLGREGGCDLLGVPDEIGRNQAEYEELYDIGTRWTPQLADLPRQVLDEMRADPEIVSFHWASADILDEKEIASAKRSMGEDEFTQEYGGKFVKSGGKVAPRFDPSVHVSADHAAYAPGLPIDWCLDFGAKHVAHLICQTYKGFIWVLDEIALRDSSTDVACDEFLDKCQRNGWDTHRIRLFGDAAGSTKGSAWGESDYEVIEKKIGASRLESYVPNHNPFVKDTVNAVRGRVRDGFGQVRLAVHPRCQRLINDLKTAPWPDGSNNLRDYHWLACLRYYCYGLFHDATTVESGGTVLPNLRG